MTEDEAKTKWCPMVRTGMYGEGSAADGMVSVNRDPRVPALANCIGSDCMMWRYHSLGVEEDDPEGFCGLAGRKGAG